MKLFEHMTVTIDALDHQGRGIAHVDGYVIFIFGALLNEVVEIEIEKMKKNIIEAKLIQILKPSMERIESKCPYFHECGGCDLLHMNYQKQLEYKEQKVKEIMKKFAGIEDKVKRIVANDSIFGYRNKVIFQVEDNIGFYKKKSNQVIDIKECLLLSDNMNHYLAIIKEKMNLKFVKQVMMRESETLNDMMIVFDVEECFRTEQIPKELYKVSIILKRNDYYQVVSGNGYILEQVKNFVFKISPASFFQVNTRQMERLYEKVVDSACLTGHEKVLDLYCGTGTIGIFLSGKAKDVLGIEINESAVEDALWNRRENHISNIQFLCGDTGTVLEKTKYEPDVVVVDPPRAGLDERAIEELKKIHSKKIIYVSCDPVTLARDLKRLENDYEVISIVPVDMFSNTYHVECVSVLHRKSLEK